MLRLYPASGPPHSRAMAILKIARMGHPVLRRPADPVVDPHHPDIARLIDDMRDTLADAGGVGLAAPQVHVPLRLMMFFVPERRCTALEGDVAQGLTVLVNPWVEPLEGSEDGDWEGCLSLPEMQGWVRRPRHIRYGGTLPSGETMERVAAGFHARVVQHEYDHLDGVLYPQRMTDLGLFGYGAALMIDPPRPEGGGDDPKEDL